jgi:hypothetical protein
MVTNTKNKIDDLRNHLFETLEALKDEEKPMDLARARTIADVARVLIDSAKVEVEYLNVTGQLNTTGFLPVEANPAAPRQLQSGPRAVGTGVR